MTINKTQIKVAVDTSGDRKIEDLLNLDSYKDMSDSEINKLINWYMDMARRDEDIAIKTANSIMNENALIEDRRKVTKESNAILKEVLATPLNLVKLDGGENNES